jgi:hypothetical protein
VFRAGNVAAACYRRIMRSNRRVIAAAALAALICVSSEAAAQPTYRCNRRLLGAGQR